MMDYVLILRKLKRSRVREMVRYLRSHVDLQERKFFLEGDHKNSKPRLIPIEPEEGAEEEQCWCNVREACKKGRGNPIFGWAFWPDELNNGANGVEQVVIAQYHVILHEISKNRFVDVTPQVGGYLHRKVPHILFMADNRVGFDYAKPYQPPLLCMWGPSQAGVQSNFVWLDEMKNAVKNPFGMVSQDNFVPLPVKLQC